MDFDEDLLVCDEPLLSPSAMSAASESPSGLRMPTFSYDCDGDGSASHSTSTNRSRRRTRTSDGGNDDTELKLMLKVLGVPFMRHAATYKLFSCAILIGFVEGVIAIAFFGLSHYICTVWTTCVVCGDSKGPYGFQFTRVNGNETATLSSIGKVGFGQGDWCWLIVSVLGSLLAGALVVYKGAGIGNVPNMFQESSDLKVRNYCHH